MAFAAPARCGGWAGRRRRALSRVASASSSSSSSAAAEAHEAAFAPLPRDACLAAAEASTAHGELVGGAHEWFYGEVDHAALADVLNDVARAAPGETFVDLGSGAGKAVATAALAAPFARCRGVELLPELHAAALEGLRRLEAEAASRGAPLADVELLEGNMLCHDVSDADVVYIHATCLERQTVQYLEWQLEEQLRPGARVLIISKPLSSPALAPLGNGVVPIRQAHADTSLDMYTYVKQG